MKDKDMNCKEGNSEIKPSSSTKMYLMVYNFIQSVCCFIILVRLLLHDYQIWRGKPNSLDQSISNTLIFTNLLMFLEVFHVTIGIASSNLKITVAQIFLRTYIACIVTRVVQNSMGFCIMVHAWAIGDLVRYSYFILSSLKYGPHFIKWLRYSFFIIAVPLNCIGEYICLFAAHVHVMMNGPLHIRIVNAVYVTLLNQKFLYILYIISIPLTMQIYLYLLKRRNEALGYQTISTGTTTTADKKSQ